MFASEFLHPRARQLIQTLAWLRICAVIGQATTVATVVLVFSVGVPLVPILTGLAVLVLFALFAFWRLAQSWPTRPLEAFAHVAIDTLFLTWLLYFAGGAANPFVSLYVIPIALVATSMPLRYVFATFVLALLCYTLLIFRHVPLPPRYSADLGGFSLYVTSTAMGFLVTVSVLGFFIFRMARALRAREAEVQRKRERELRDEGILAIATQAAATAHDLNTPLSTIRTLLAELRHEMPSDGLLTADFDVLSSQVERCRDILRNLVAVGSRQLTGTPQRLSLCEFMRDCDHQFHLLRPEVNLITTLDDDARDTAFNVDPNFRHALINLLSNAADASRTNSASYVELSAVLDRDVVEFRIRDHGHGEGIIADAGTLFKTSKCDGLGLGLALAHSTVERLGGELSAHALAEGGLLQRLRLPITAARNRVT
ncbi:MAG: sensor histidine kinase [Rhodanobacter sp.]|jgi:two-component system sensor histidine kinase RegB|nr:sensor histidine kinase [Rhodanobacter sp.]